MNNIIPYLNSAVPLPGYKLFVEFDDGVRGNADLSAWVGKGVFKAWHDENNFKKFIITSDKKSEWNDNIDMDPDAFYLKLIENWQNLSVEQNGIAKKIEPLK